MPDFVICLLAAAFAWWLLHLSQSLLNSDHVGKEIVRWMLWPYAVMTGGEFKAMSGTCSFRFLEWVYGPGESQFHCILSGGALSPPLNIGPNGKLHETAKWPKKSLKL